MNEDAPPRVLLVEDDAGIGRVVCNGLRQHGIDVDWLRRGGEAGAMLSKSAYQAVILDLMLPDGDGFSICRSLRAQGFGLPVCMLTARDALDDKLEGFDAGADDYLTKPFAIDELVARLRALFRRHSASATPTRWELRDLLLDCRAREASVGARILTLTRREFDALAFLLRHAGEVVSRDRLLDAVWAADRSVTANTVDVYVGYLRKKLLALESTVRIEAVRGVGFKLC